MENKENLPEQAKEDKNVQTDALSDGAQTSAEAENNEKNAAETENTAVEVDGTVEMKADVTVDVKVNVKVDTKTGGSAKPPKRYNEKVAKTVRTTVNVLTTVIVSLVVIFAILIVGVRFFGVQLYIILSGSMEPEYHTGGLIYVVEVDPDDLKVGDDITFKLSNGTPATHRIIEILPHPDDPTPENPSMPPVYRTQGIANEHPDANYVEERSIIGKPIFSLPYLGYVVDFIQSPKGIYSCAIGAIVLIILMILPDVIFPKEEEKKGKKKKKKGDAEAPATDGAPSDAEASDAPAAETPSDPPSAPAEKTVPTEKNENSEKSEGDANE